MALHSRFPIRCQALWIVLLGNCNPLVIPSTSSAEAVTPQAVNGLRNSSTTVVRRMLASKKAVEEVRVEDPFYININMQPDRKSSKIYLND